LLLWKRRQLWTFALSRLNYLLEASCRRGLYCASVPCEVLRASFDSKASSDAQFGRELAAVATVASLRRGRERANRPTNRKLASKFESDGRKTPTSATIGGLRAAPGASRPHRLRHCSRSSSKPRRSSASSSDSRGLGSTTLAADAVDAG
jgi:hypothetical protein